MKITVAVFFGGRSVEHEVSIISAVQAMQNMNRDTYTIVPVYISKQGDWYTGDELLDIKNYKDLDALLKRATQVYFKPFNGDYKLYLGKPSFLQSQKHLEIDVAFPVTHGTLGEDGALQGLFELMGLPYVGCDVLSSAIGMDKVITKQVLKANDIPVVDYLWFTDEHWIADSESVLQSIETQIGYPAVIKPANLGSSVGISKADNREVLNTSVDYALQFAQKLIIEKAISPLKEVNCAVLGDYEHCDCSILEEPLTSGAFLSYRDKYMSKSGSSKGKSGPGSMANLQRRIPADISPETASAVKDLAERTFKAIGAAGVSRVDFLIHETDHQVYVNEINTIPGSLAFYLWEPVGKKYPELLDDLIQLALKRHRERANLAVSYNENLLAYVGGGAKGGGSKPSTP